MLIFRADPQQVVITIPAHSGLQQQVVLQGQQGLPTAIPAATIQPQSVVVPQADLGTVIYAQNPDVTLQHGQVLTADLATRNPAGASVDTAQPMPPTVPVNPAGATTQVTTTGQPASATGADLSGTHIDAQANIASQVSFRSLKSGPRDNM